MLDKNKTVWAASTQQQHKAAVVRFVSERRVSQRISFKLWGRAALWFVATASGGRAIWRRFPPLSHTSKEDTCLREKSEEGAERSARWGRGAETDGFDCDHSQADSGADDPAPNAALHKFCATAEGNDRSKQGVIANTSNQLWQGQRCGATGNRGGKHSVLEKSLGSPVVLYGAVVQHRRGLAHW